MKKAFAMQIPLSVLKMRGGGSVAAAQCKPMMMRASSFSDNKISIKKVAASSSACREVPKSLTGLASATR